MFWIYWNTAWSPLVISSGIPTHHHRRHVRRRVRRRSGRQSRRSEPARLRPDLRGNCVPARIGLVVAMAAPVGGVEDGFRAALLRRGAS